MALKIHLHVKFRAFGITFSEVDQNFVLPVALPGAVSTLPKKLYDQRGILLEYSIG